jgi:hypothetical protein
MPEEQVLQVVPAEPVDHTVVPVVQVHSVPQAEQVIMAEQQPVLLSMVPVFLQSMIMQQQMPI